MPGLHLFGIVAGGWQMGRMAVIARARITAGDGEPFWPAKLATTRFFADHFPDPGSGPGGIRDWRGDWRAGNGRRQLLTNSAFCRKPAIVVIIAGLSTCPTAFAWRGFIPERVCMRHYEICFIVHPDQSEQVPGMVERYRTIVTAKGGIHRLEDWGRRQPSLPDPEDPQGSLRPLMNIECDGETLNELEHSFKFNAMPCCAIHRQDEGRGDDSFADDGREVQVDDAW